MKKLLRSIALFWNSYWREDSDDPTKMHLSQSDKRLLLYGAFMICLVCIAATAILLSIVYTRTLKHYTKKYEELIDLLRTGMDTLIANR